MGLTSKAIPGAADTEAGARRFLEEARHFARVRSSNVLVIHGVDEHDGQIGFWTHLVRGQTLYALLRDRGPLGVAEATRIGMALCHALAAVHAVGLIHGDVKLSNVMMGPGGRILLMDFGAVSRRVNSEGPDPVFGPAFGTPLLLAPEVLRAEVPRPASNLYSLGALLHQLGWLKAEATLCPPAAGRIAHES